MKKRLLLALAMIIALSLVVVVFSGCPLSMEPGSGDDLTTVTPGGSDDSSDDESSSSSSDVTLTAYNPVTISDFTALGEAQTENVRTALETYLDDGDVTNAEAFVMGVVAEAFGTMIGTNVASTRISNDINLYSKPRTLEALLHLHLYNEGIELLYDDPATTDVTEDIVLSDIYIENLELLLKGKIDSLTALLLSIDSMNRGIIPFDLGADGSAGISIALESTADPRLLDDVPDFTVAATEAELEGFASLFADFDIELDLEADEAESERLVEEDETTIMPTGTISGEAAISIGTNFAYVDLNEDGTDDFIRIPIVLEAKLPAFTSVNLEQFTAAFTSYNEALYAGASSDATTIETAYDALSTLLWGADSGGLNINLYLGDDSADTPIELYSGLDAMNMFLDTLLDILLLISGSPS